MLRKLFATIFACFSMVCAMAAVNINTATEAQLETLKGIGPAKAKAILEHRTKNGPFKSIEALKDVKGIGEATFNSIKGEISTSGATMPPAGKPDAKPAKPDAAKDGKKPEPMKDPKKAEKPASKPAPKADKAMKKDASKDAPKDAKKKPEEKKQ
ncbi:helix-hairpin-helix domain-containing protein [Leeia sp. TBRC 13508]|uniref:Helix-hairpin-helix domain-containing protein n=1 Tax=Leeia speluncae TaxID=2884804 RepID=A0ABS8D9C2_9NEIS|nr:helix-hairpin-helix domain-containing protein [Leeia speluncae]MCB6184800.1 helix-hairpin-helix domain-containing protein [Leeia speluncae]